SCFSSPRVLLHLHSFPTRRSSDLREVVTVSPYDRLEDAIYLMMKNHVGILPVVENNRVHGIITDKDVFKAFLEISGYGEEGVRRSEEHTSELQSRFDLVCRLLLEK